MPNQESMLFYDGTCSVCNRAVAFVHRHDRHHRIELAPFGSAPAQEKINSGKGPAEEDSVVFIEEGKRYTHSSAVLKILKKLGFPWSLLYVFVIVPVPLRDSLYRWVAKNRHKWQGKKRKHRVQGYEGPNECRS